MISMRATDLGLIAVTLCAIFGAFYPRSAAAVAYVPHTVIEQPTIDTTMFKQSGANVYLFHGATQEAIQPLVGQDFTVFRESAAGCPSGKLLVGKIRITKSAGDHHLEAVVMEGELKEGDVAHLGAIYGLVVLTKERCETLKQPDQEPKK
jgi:hypothetical protein